MAKEKSAPLVFRISLEKSKAVQFLRKAEILGIEGLPKSGAINLIPLKEVSLEIAIDEGSFDALSGLLLSFSSLMQMGQTIVEKVKMPAVSLNGIPLPKPKRKPKSRAGLFIVDPDGQVLKSRGDTLFIDDDPVTERAAFEFAQKWDPDQADLFWPDGVPA